MEFIALFCLIAGVQGIFLTIHFWFKRDGIDVLNLLVGLLLAVYSLNLVNTYAYLEGFQLAHEILQPISNYLGWWVGPSIYFYVLYPAKPESWKQAIWIHYVPVIPIAFTGTLWPETIPFIAVVFYFQFSAYLAVTIYRIVKGDTDRNLLSWIKPFIYAVGLIKLVNIILVSLEIARVWTITDTTRISFILLAAFPIFLIAYREMNAARTFEPSAEKYGESGVEADEIDSYFKQIREVLEKEKLYLNPNLKLEHLADKTGIHKRKISQVVNESQKKNFSRFINEYRLHEAAEMLTDPDCSHLSILGIAKECGFNSGGRFNTLFRDKFGTTPSQYRKNIAQQAE